MFYHNYEKNFSINGHQIFVLTEWSRSFGYILKRKLLSRWKPPPYFFHLRKGGHVAAAQQHFHSRLFVSIDLEKFFDSVTRTKICRSLQSVGILHREAYDIACKSTVDKKSEHARFSLPFGFVQSNALASLVLDKSKLGNLLKDLSSNDKMIVSVYVDDIVVSSCNNNYAAMHDVKERIHAAAACSNFNINSRKSQGPSGEIGIFNLILGQRSFYVCNEQMRRFEASVLDGFLERSAALIAYVRTINTQQAADLEKLLHEQQEPHDSFDSS
jgi:hypothetical protein